MDSQFTKTWHETRLAYPLEWASWLGCPNWYDGGRFVNRTPEEHTYSKYLR